LSFQPKYLSFLDSLDLQLADTQQSMKRLDPVGSLEMLSPLLLESLHDLALWLLNNGSLDREVLLGDVGLTLDGVVL